MPVILWGNKNICRSSTLSQKLEYMLQTAHNQVKNQLLYGYDHAFKMLGSGIDICVFVYVRNGSTDQLSMAHMETLRYMDIGIIEQLAVKYILVCLHCRLCAIFQFVLRSFVGSDDGK